MRAILATVAALAITGCGQSSPDYQIDDQVAAKAQLTAILKDPDSAEFDEVRAYRYRVAKDHDDYNFCGTVNAKNGFGGYSGAQRFSANNAVAAIDDGSSAFDVIWNRYCTDDTGGQTVWF